MSILLIFVLNGCVRDGKEMELDGSWMGVVWGVWNSIETRRNNIANYTAKV